MSTFANDWLLHSPGAVDFAAAYLSLREATQAAAQAAMRENAAFAPLLATQTPAQRDAAYAAIWHGVERSCAGDWEVRAATVRALGIRYARVGATIEDWQDIAQRESEIVRAELFRRWLAEPDRLLAAVDALQRFVDRSFGVFAAAYLDTAQEELKQSDLWFQLMSSGLVIVEAGGALRKANHAFLELYGLTEESLRTRTLASLFDADDLERTRALYTASAEQTGRAGYDTVHVRSDGTSFPARVEAVRLSTVDMPPVWGISIHDLTDRRQVEALRVRSAELEAENQKVRQASRVKSEFIANMSHELRTPLNSILGFSELLEAGEVGALSARQLDFVHDIHTSGKHLLRLINDVLDLSKVEAGKLEFYPEDIDLLQVTREVAQLTRGIAPDRHIDVEVEDAVRHGYLDQGRFKQVLYNYLSNALKFSPPTTRVSVHIKAEGPGAFRLSVRDHGVGVAAEDLKRLFLVFEQLDAGRGKHHGGTGLGLALTRRLVEAQGGLVEADSEVGVGSTFHAILPLQAPGTASLPEPRQILGAHAGCQHVLVIEDDPEDQDRIVTALVGAGYAVDTAATGAQAMRAVRERRYDAITLDLILPDTHGFALLAEIRRVPGLAQVPVVVISVVSAQATGAIVVHATLQKPLQSDQLVAALQRLGTPEDHGGAVLVIDDDEASARLMAQSLTHLGFRAAVAHDGLEALEVVRRERPLAIVLDLAMPKLDGFGFLRRYREEFGAVSVPILVWSVKDLSREEREELLQSARAVIPKDGSGMRTLLDTLRTHLGQRPAL